MPKQEIALLLPVLSLILPRNYGKKYVRNEMQLLSLLSENIWNSLAGVSSVLEKFHLCVSQGNLFAVDVFCQFHQALLLSLKE